jgi:ubiquinone/menaquinone biosynthesis C-methylase UbiE
MRRVVIPELLDTDAGTAGEIAASLSDLQRINRLFGGVSTTQAMVERIAQTLGKNRLSLLEVAAGAGYVPRTVAQRLSSRDVELQVTLLDRARSHLNGSDGQSVVGDALQLPFREGSFDLVSCCLFVHHLEPKEIVQFVDNGLRVCRTALLINDLVRHPLHLALTYAGMPLYRSRITRHDAVASVRRAYTVEEMKEMLQNPRAAQVEIEPHYLYRMGAIVWKGA